MTRRDYCHLVGVRAQKLRGEQAVKAWLLLAERLEEMGTMELPKFKHLIGAIRAAHIESGIK